MFILGSTIKYNRSQVPLSATNILNNCTTNNSAQTVYLDSPYSATITADVGYTLEGSSILITMGGVDVTASVYNNGVITIASVSGDIIISIAAVESGPQPLPTSYFTYTSVTGGSEISGFSSAGQTAYVNGEITALILPSEDGSGNPITSIGIEAFYNCTNLTSITIPNGVTSIGNTTFYNCTGLTSVTIPDSITSIGNNTFRSCTGLESITLGNSVTSIGYWAFRDCTSLTTITIPTSITSIGYQAFCNCSSLTSITIEATTPPVLGSGVFDDTNDCPIYVPAQSVSDYQNATNWTNYAARIQPIPSLYILNSTPDISTDYNWSATNQSAMRLTSFYDNTVSQSAFIASINVNSQGYILCNSGNVLPAALWVANSQVYAVLKSQLEGMGIPIDDSGVTSQSGWLFVEGDLSSVSLYNCAPIIYFYLGNDDGWLDNVGFSDWLINNSTITRSITIPNTVTSIGDYAFYYCSGLTGTLTIPNSVTSIGLRAFWGCDSLTSIEIPNSVTSIGNYAFIDCSGLTSITVDDNNPNYKSVDNCLLNKAGTTLIAGCKNSTIPNTVTSIGDYAFYYCSGLTGTLTIPNSVTSIGLQAFRWCTGLTSVTIGSGVASMRYDAFWGCDSLTSITVDSSNTIYDSRDNCNCIIETATNTLIAGCKNSTIPNTVTSIADGAFSSCSGLTSITIPNSVTSIGNYAFQNCSGLTSITVEPIVPPELGYGAFMGTNDAPIYVPAQSVSDYQNATNWTNYAARIQPIQ